MPTPHISLLSPARDYDTAVAAIQAGADAVYIGAPLFGARQAASNSLHDIRRLVRNAHPFGVKVLITLNTILTDDELPQAVALAWDLYHAGADALIIQDLRLLEQNLPPLRLHASTQCDNRTPEQVARLRDLGFARVVLARELSLDEIQAIRNAVPDIELEAFIHGALCVSYSGRCYLSEHLTGRSANRGCCAQMCRLPYDLLDADGAVLRDDDNRPIAQRYVLSLRDLDRSASLAQLIQAGVTTFKIEGRLKDAAYVTNITAYYRQLLDRLLPAEQPNHPITFHFTPDPAKTFHRGATDYFLHGRNTRMANWLTPKSTGEPVGTALRADGRLLTARLNPGVTLHNGDGLTVADRGCAVNGVTAAPDGLTHITLNKPLTATAFPQPLCRNLDTAFVRTLRAERRIPLDITLSDAPEGYRLTLSAGQPGDRTTIDALFPAPHERADNADRADATIRQQLTKLGDTPFIARTLTIDLPEPRFIPIARLNTFRRDAILRLQEHLQSQPPKQLSSSPTSPTPTWDVKRLRRTEKDKRNCLSRSKCAARVRGVPHSEHIELLIGSPAVASSDAPSQNATYSSRSQTVPPLMTCRYCILHELGHCRKRAPLAREPRFLRLANGTRLTLRFNCQRCEMTIHQTDEDNRHKDRQTY